MKRFILLTAMLFGITSVATAVAASDPESPDILQFTASTEFVPQQDQVVATIFQVPANKRLVIQSVSYYRTDSAADGSIASAILMTNVTQTGNSLVLPKVVADGTGYPGASLSATFYAGAGTYIDVSAFRTGNLERTEYFSFTISGYYVKNP